MSSEVKNNNVLRETVGSHSVRLAEKTPDAPNAYEQMREQLSDYDKHMHECIMTHRKVFDGDFYIIVITKKEKIMENVLRHYFFARQSCPSPDYDQAVYKYDRLGDKITFLWVIPSVHIVRFMESHPGLVEPDQYELLGYVLKFLDGSLLQQAKALNNERGDSSFLEN